MEIIRVVVKIGETHNLGNYSSTRPEITAEATLNAGDDFGAAVDMLRKKINAKLYDHIDERLMQHGQSPHYYDGDKFDIYISQRLKLIAIVPHKAKPPVMELLHAMGHTYSDWHRGKQGFPLLNIIDSANKFLDAESADSPDWLAMRQATDGTDTVIIYTKRAKAVPVIEDIQASGLELFNSRVSVLNEAAKEQAAQEQARWKTEFPDSDEDSSDEDDE